jgi:hypothetical protein
MDGDVLIRARELVLGQGGKPTPHPDFDFACQMQPRCADLIALRSAKVRTHHPLGFCQQDAGRADASGSHEQLRPSGPAHSNAQ